MIAVTHYPNASRRPLSRTALLQGVVSLVLRKHAAPLYGLGAIHAPILSDAVTYRLRQSRAQTNPEGHWNVGQGTFDRWAADILSIANREAANMGYDAFTYQEAASALYDRGYHPVGAPPPVVKVDPAVHDLTPIDPVVVPNREGSVPSPEPSPVPETLPSAPVRRITVTIPHLTPVPRIPTDTATGGERREPAPFPAPIQIPRSPVVELMPHVAAEAEKPFPYWILAVAAGAVLLA